MGQKKQKYYVVWQGKTPGIYTSWSECEAQVKGQANAKFKAYEDQGLAEQAFRLGPEMSIGNKSLPTSSRHANSIIGVDAEGMTVILPHADASMPVPELNSIAVDAACSGNPGVMEYQGVHVLTRQQLFHFKAPMGTNNIGEFLAIVHGLAYLRKNNLSMIMYSDSVNAMNWIRQKQCKTKLPLNEQTAQLYDVIRRAEVWLHNNSYTTEIRKWETDIWGEIPADFGRKQ